MNPDEKKVKNDKKALFLGHFDHKNPVFFNKGQFKSPLSLQIDGIRGSGMSEHTLEHICPDKTY